MGEGVDGRVNTIVLEVKQDLDHDGWQDENGTVHYDDRIQTPFGQLGTLKTDTDENNSHVIVDAPDVVLIRHGFPTQWSMSAKGVSIDTTFAGVQVMTLKAVNGEVRYQLDPRNVRWSDGDEDIPFYVAQRIYADYTPKPGAE